MSANAVVESTVTRTAVIDALSPLFGRIRDNSTIDRRSGRPNGWGLIRVSVANLRLEPNHRAEMGTQTLMGTVIRILRKSATWHYAQTPDGYRSWIEAGHFIPCDRAMADAWEASNQIFVTAWLDRIWEQPDAKALPVSDVVAGSLVKKIGASGHFYNVELPDRRVGFLAKQSGMDYVEWKRKACPSPDNIEQTARHLVGVPYMWGGTSPKALDCSGFTKTVFLLNGLQLNRDARHQAHQGKELDPGRNFENLRKGDLLFFGRKATPRAPEQITHVAIYLEDRKYIHAASMVKFNSLDSASPLFDEKRLKTFVRVRRILSP